MNMESCTIVVSHLKGTATVYKPHVPRRCLSSQGTSMYPRVHEGCWATVASSQNCETISGYYKSYYGTSHLYHGFQRCMGFVPSCSCMSSLGLRPREDIQLPSGTNPIHLETHGTNITCANHENRVGLPVTHVCDIVVKLNLSCRLVESTDFWHMSSLQ